MEKLLNGLKISAVAVVVALGMGFVSSAPQARAESRPVSFDEPSLVTKVQMTNAGWDWEPRCAGGAHWSWNDMRCKGGTGKHHHRHHHDDDDCD
jgi:hypothetical protein